MRRNRKGRVHPGMAVALMAIASLAFATCRSAPRSELPMDEATRTSVSDALRSTAPPDSADSARAVTSAASAAPSRAAPAGAGAGALAEVERGRLLVLHHGCGDCHGGIANPAADDWLAGMRDTTQQFRIAGFVTRPRNLTPDNQTGLGRFSERQIFNALRYGLRPGETPDVEITSTVPGEGNHPSRPKYLAPPMPWPAFRHMPDDDLRAIAAYLKRGVRPVRNRVPDSEGPPDFWASAYAEDRIGSYPAPPFPAAGEMAPVARVP